MNLCVLILPQKIETTYHLIMCLLLIDPAGDPEVLNKTSTLLEVELRFFSKKLVTPKLF